MGFVMDKIYGEIHVGKKSGVQLMLSVGDRGIILSRIQFRAKHTVGLKVKSCEFKTSSFTEQNMTLGV